MVASRWIRVVAENIDYVIAGVPGCSYRVPDPDQVAQLVMVGKPVKHELVESHTGFGPLGAPPEPATLGFMKGPPEDRNVGCLEAEE